MWLYRPLLNLHNAFQHTILSGLEASSAQCVRQRNEQIFGVPRAEGDRYRFVFPSLQVKPDARRVSADVGSYHLRMQINHAVLAGESINLETRALGSRLRSESREKDAFQWRTRPTPASACSVPADDNFFATLPGISADLSPLARKGRLMRLAVSWRGGLTERRFRHSSKAVDQPESQSMRSTCRRVIKHRFGFASCRNQPDFLSSASC